ncbi:hypothetical protein [Rugamonas sp.]|uniref:hypothetical protein n=1 Tax=Rugamonas sp. TaxID=1926287 RepID=UPI0025FD41FE|nr:hypothetical protein [Rugamonas sp.]
MPSGIGWSKSTSVVPPRGDRGPPLTWVPMAALALNDAAASANASAGRYRAAPNSTMMLTPSLFYREPPA